MNTWLNRGASGGLAGALFKSKDEFNNPPRTQKSGHSPQHETIKTKAPRAQDFTNKTVRKGSVTEELERMVNRAKSRTRARVEHVFGVVKRLWKFDKVRYRGLAKNATRAFVTLAMANIFLARRPLLTQVRA